MNTYDVRNMETKQWVFWATALPLIVIIITLCLTWAGELGNFWKGFRDLWRGKKGRVGVAQYSALERPHAYSTADPRVTVERRHRRYGDDDSDDQGYYDERPYRSRATSGRFREDLYNDVAPRYRR